MTAPADADLPEPASAGASPPEPAPADASRPEPAPADASRPEPAPVDVSPPQPAPVDVSRPEPVSPDGSTSPDALLMIEQHLRGHHAGFASRLFAFLFDCVVSIGIFEITLAAASFAASVLTGHSIHWSKENLWVVIAFFIWEFLYFAYAWTSSGKTPGMWLLGVQVVGQDGTSVGTRRGLVRTLAFPLSFILLGLGFISILFEHDRRALHDLIAGTAVVYCWDARAARLRSLAREGGDRRHKRHAGPSADAQPDSGHLPAAAIKAPPRGPDAGRPALPG